MAQSSKLTGYVRLKASPEINNRLASFQIKELSRFFRVIAIDLKGFSDSDKPQWRKEYTPNKICGELAQFIRSLGSNSATIIGHDLGAVIG